MKLKRCKSKTFLKLKFNKMYAIIEVNTGKTV